MKTHSGSFAVAAACIIGGLIYIEGNKPIFGIVVSICIILLYILLHSSSKEHSQ